MKRDALISVAKLVAESKSWREMIQWKRRLKIRLVETKFPKSRRDEMKKRNRSSKNLFFRRRIFVFRRRFGRRSRFDFVEIQNVDRSGNDSFLGKVRFSSRKNSKKNFAEDFSECWFWSWKRFFFSSFRWFDRRNSFPSSFRFFSFKTITESVDPKNLRAIFLDFAFSSKIFRFAENFAHRKLFLFFQPEILWFFIRSGSKNEEKFFSPKTFFFSPRIFLNFFLFFCAKFFLDDPPRSEDSLFISLASSSGSVSLLLGLIYSAELDRAEISSRRTILTVEKIFRWFSRREKTSIFTSATNSSPNDFLFLRFELFQRNFRDFSAIFE